MYINKELARRMESCIKQTHIEVTRQYPQGKILIIGDGAACFSGFESFLSQVVGWGFTTKPKHFKAEIETIEHFYKSLGHPRIDIELCPYVGNELAVYLSQRGYRVTELNSIAVMDINTSPLLCADSASNLIIKQVAPAEFNKWAERIAQGFGYPEAKDQFQRYIQSTGVVTFAAYDAEQIIAGATIALHGDVCDLGVTSTIPAYRGRGLQKRLVAARLDFARQQGLSIATVTTEPGTISELNAQKMGFKPAYTRIKMTLE